MGRARRWHTARIRIREHDGRSSMEARAARGHSSIEIAVALALVGILLAGAVMGILAVINLEHLDGWVRAMTFDIGAGQQTAMAERTTVTVTLTGNSYSIATAGGITLRQQVMPTDISITNTCAANACSFDRRGVPSSAGTITLRSASTGKTYTITIQTTTGRVSYQ
jgi:hypothetical protein